MQLPRTIWPHSRQVFFGNRTHLLFEISCTQAGMDAGMRFAKATVGHEEGDDLPIRLPNESDILQAYLSAVQACVPAGIIKPGHMPAPLAPVVEYEYLAQELAHTPEIVFSLVATND